MIRSSVLSGVAGLVLLLVPTSAQAQTCSQLVDDLRSWVTSGGPNPINVVRVTVVSNQKNTISTWSGTVGSTYSAAELSSWSGLFLMPYTGNPGKQLFSDRVNLSCTGSSQPLSANSSETIEVFVSSSEVWLHNLSWNYWIQVTSLSCANGVMFGFGTAIGSNGGLPALWILSFAKTTHIT